MITIRQSLLFFLATTLFLTGFTAFAQDVVPDATQDQLESAAGGDIPAELLEFESEGSEQQPVLLGVGLSSGFPGFNRFGVQASMQYRFFGMALKAAPTAAGLYFGATLRGYVPVGGFVPMYVGVGGGVYGESSELHLVVGGHVPIAEQFRLDLEAGAARVSAFDSASWLPWVSIGVSYTVPVAAGDLSLGSGAPSTRTALASGSSMALCGDPTEASLLAAFSRTLNSLVRNGEATYAGSYTDLQYNYRITDTDITGTSGYVAISYSGSVRIIGGGRESASGSASASFEWTGCGWRRSSVDY